MNRRFARARWTAMAAAIGSLVACGRPGARSPGSAGASLPAAFARAFREDQLGAADDAVSANLDVVRAAAHADGDPFQLAALEAALDALVLREIPALGDAVRDGSLAYRSGKEGAIRAELERLLGDAKGAFARGILARALVSLAERGGDAVRAAVAREASGCAREATVLGPTLGTPVTGVLEVEALDRPGARLAAALPIEGPFGLQTSPVTASARGCALPLFAASPRPGVREVLIDLAVPRAQTIGLVLRAHGAALLRAGGTIVAQRAFELGDGEAARFVRVAAAAGPLRLVLRVGTAKDDDVVELDAFDDGGAPLHASAPRAGSQGGGRVLGFQESGIAAAKTQDEAVLAAAGALAAGDPRTAERTLWAAATRSDARPDVSLIYARAVATARDLSAPVRGERARSAYERALSAWPTSWEAVVAHAVLAGVRRGREESGLETLVDLDAGRAKGARETPVVAAFDAMVSGHEKLFDRAEAALSRARAMGKTALFEASEAAVHPRIGTERAQATCAQSSEHDTLACYDAIRATGDRLAAARELARLREVLGSVSEFLPIELREALSANDDAAAQRAFAAMLPGERTLSALALLGPKAGLGDRLLRLARTASDAPGGLGPLLAAFGESDASGFDAEADRVVAEDRAKPILPDAATAVLAHSERYAILDDGLLHWTLFDVRRVSGTTDVEENAQAGAPEITGRGAVRALRRRILKKDGRVLEPDRTPRASQAHADLSQLEQGDSVEAVYEGYALPNDTGDVGIDTPDLLPERTGVHEATVTLQMPRALQGATWSHPLLGKPQERMDGARRTLTWRMSERPTRRIEDGVPKMDRNVAVSFSTASWAGVARALRENVATLDEHDPEIAAWARAAVMGSRESTRAQVEALVTAAGQALHEASAEVLSDVASGPDAVQTQTARTFLAAQEGSRDWLVLRGLRELGIPAELVLAENDPYSADPSFPPHYGRFAHPLVVAHLAAPKEDLWVDADVPGPPLPAGRISPELRGRLALREDGRVEVLPSLGAREDERDEVDIRLALDAEGSARGSFAVVLRGRDAQQLAEALFRLVGADRQRALRDVVLAWLPWANVDGVELASSEGSWQVSLRAGVSVSGYAQALGKKTWLLPGMDPLHWSWPRARVSSLSAAFATRAGRESALSLSSAVQYHVHRRVELPRNASVARVPGPLEVRGKLVEASRKISVGSGAVEDEFTLAVTTGTIGPESYGAFVVEAHAADDGFLASTSLSLTSGPPGP